MQKRGSKPTFGGLLLQHLIVFLICIVFPGVVTSVVPASWLSFKRSGEAVSCTARTCVFFIVPYKVQRIDRVTGIDHRERAGGTRRQRQYGRDTAKVVQVDGEGFLQILGDGDQVLEVSVSPASLDSVLNKSQKFLNSSNESSKTLFVIANWKFGAMMGGVLTCFTVLYVFGYSIELLKMLALGTKRLFLR